MSSRDKYDHNNYVRTKKVKDMTREERAEYEAYLQYKRYYRNEEQRKKMIEWRKKAYHAKKERQALQQQQQQQIPV